MPKKVPASAFRHQGQSGTAGHKPYHKLLKKYINIYIATAKISTRKGIS